MVDATRCLVDGQPCEHLSVAGGRDRCVRYFYVLAVDRADGTPLRCAPCLGDAQAMHRAAKARRGQAPRPDAVSPAPRGATALVRVATADLEGQLRAAQRKNVQLAALLERWRRWYEGALVAKREAARLQRALDLVAARGGADLVRAALVDAEEGAGEHVFAEGGSDAGAGDPVR